MPAACAPWRGDAVAEPGWQCRLANPPNPAAVPGPQVSSDLAGREKLEMGSGARPAPSPPARIPAPPRARPHPALAAVVPAGIRVGPVHGERRVAARHVCA